MRRMWNRGRLWLITSFAGGGSLFVLEGCDPTVRDTVLSGVEGAATTLFGTFIQAFFESLVAEEDTGIATVQMVVEQAASLVA